MSAPPIAERHLHHFHRRAPIKELVRAATTANITISTALNNGDSLDGVTLATDDRVLVKNQSTGAENGIYVVGASPARSYDVSTDDPAYGYIVLVLQGTANAGTLWQNTNTSAPTIGSTALTFAAVGSTGATITTKDEGSTLSSTVTTLDFTGAGVTASGGGATTTVNIPGGGGASQSYVGYNTVGGTAENIVSNRVIAKSVTLASPGTLTSIEFYVDTTSDSVSGSWFVGVWDDNSSAIGTLRSVTGAIGADAEILSGTGSSFPARWVSRPCGIYLAAGTYWLGFMVNDVSGPLRIYRDGSGTDRRLDSGGAWIPDGQRYTQTDTTFKYSIRGNLLS